MVTSVVASCLQSLGNVQLRLLRPPYAMNGIAYLDHPESTVH